MSKIKRAASLLLIGVVSLLGNASTQAALIDRGNGLIYDTVLDVTWVQDVALSATLGNPGIFNWSGAKAWVDQLVYAGYDDWRLPTLGPINGVQFNRSFNCDGSADYGYGVAAPGSASAGFTGNELAYMYHVNLGNKSRCTGEWPNVAWGPDVGVQNATFVDALTGDTVSFLNLEDIKQGFWSGLAPIRDFTWALQYTGFNDWDAAFQLHRAWAVRNGDVFVAAVPEPNSVLLLLSGLVPAFLLRKKWKGSQRRT